MNRFVVGQYDDRDIGFLIHVIIGQQLGQLLKVEA